MGLKFEMSNGWMMVGPAMVLPLCKLGRANMLFVNLHTICTLCQHVVALFFLHLSSHPVTILFVGFLSSLLRIPVWLYHCLILSPLPLRNIQHDDASSSP